MLRQRGKALMQAWRKRKRLIEDSVNLAYDVRSGHELCP
jgi:hypothetical protein